MRMGELVYMDYVRMFNNMHPGFFQSDNIRNRSEEDVFTELVMDLHKDMTDIRPVPCPEGITFGEYHGDPDILRKAVSLVESDWVQYYGDDDRFFCAFDGENIVSFCILEDMGCHQGMHTGGPGCVGTIPEMRGQGIGLEMVRRATLVLKKENFDISWIHYTHLDHWYMKIGYTPVLRWNSRGIIQDPGKPV